ncbi:mechanosensitive ion channel domain-containing protein [Zooshikella ganghwensis]|uniref:Uncharacterized protein n=1 Tax=Zooshikella ganghwensis TaxID=202772 RepID=A0A4P9VS61_9GAMM|nr:mechanosensitive ion channel domain-containing protein [Zooshikella ganghwensis]RDH45487.1 hypothetical protein B9G39_19680 [Zooshikella ganghwensis]
MLVVKKEPHPKALANSRKMLIDKTLSIQRAYLLALSELDATHRRLKSAVERYANYLNKRLLWIRSTEPISLATISHIPKQTIQLLNHERWIGVFKTLMDDVVLSPIFSIVLFFTASLLLARQKLYKLLRRTGVHIGNLRLDRVNQTFKGIGLILILALPAPLLMMCIGWQMSISLNANNFSKMVGNTLLILGPLLFHLTAFRLFLAPGSIALVHFNWEPNGVKQLYRDLGWFSVLIVGLAFIVTLAFQDPLLGSGSGLLRVVFILLMIVLLVFLIRLSKPIGGTLSLMALEHQESILFRFRYLWFLLLVVPPIASIIFSMAGYLFTAGTLIERVLQSFWFALLIIILHQLILRWLTLNQRRLRLEAALERRQAEQKARVNKEAIEETDSYYLHEIEEPQVDFIALDNASQKLLNNMLIVIGIIGLWGLWSDVFPALQIFNDITLWSYTRSENNQIIPITLSSVALAILVLIVTIIATKQLPAFIEITLLQRLNMTQGSRYTVNTLTRYTIIAVGLVWFFSLLGGSWSEIQWIFAALSVGIGFGLQEIVANFISGLIILFERPIRIGDVVTVGNTDGVVTRIQIRATTIRNFDRKELLVPNKNFITQELLNWSLSDQTTRIMIQIGIAYGSDVKTALFIIEQVAKEHHRVMHDPAPSTVFESFGDNALLLSLRCFVESIDFRIGTITELNLAINDKMIKAGIEIAFPQKDIHLDTRRPLDVRLLNSENIATK